MATKRAPAKHPVNKLELPPLVAERISCALSKWKGELGRCHWCNEAITGKRDAATSNFQNYAGPLTETILLGNLAVYAAAGGEGKKIEWDAEKLEATNAPEVAKIVKKDYRGNYGSYLDA